MIRRSIWVTVFAAVFVVGGHLARGAGEQARVLFEDQFKGKLAEGWGWVFEDKDNWRVADGKLQIRATGGASFMREHTGKNYLLRTPPEAKDAELSFEAYVENKPTEQWEHAGLLWFYDDQNFVILNKERNNYDHKTSIMFGIEKDEKFPPRPAHPSDVADPVFDAEGVWLRFRVKGTQIIGEYRAKPTDPWLRVGGGELPVKGPPRVGFHAGLGPKKDLSRWASFSHFQIVELAAK